MKDIKITNEEPLPRSKSHLLLKILTLPIILFVLSLVVIMWEAFIPKGYLYFSSVSLPDDIKKQGINENYIKREAINFIQVGVDSASVKVNEIFPSEKKITDIREHTSLIPKVLKRSDKIFEENRFQIGIGDFKLSYAKIVKFLRRKFGKRDIYADVSFIKDKNKVDAVLSLQNSGGEPQIKEFSMTFDSTQLTYKQVFKLLTQKISVVLEEKYDPIVAVLSDYNYSASYDANSQSWHNNFYAENEKEKILKDVIAGNAGKYQAKWGNMLLGSMYEEGGMNHQNENAVSECIKYYENALKVDTLHAAIISSNVNDLKNYMQQSFSSNADMQLLQTILHNNKKISSAGQIVVCYNTNANINDATFIGFEKKNNNWDVGFSKIQVNIGTKGFAEFQKKTEGDMKAPTGIFPIGDVYGYKNDLISKMTFITLTNQHVWITDPESPKYNQLVAEPPGTEKFERMIEPAQLNKYGIIINYNMNPVVKGKGSAITMHIQRRAGFATAGCISMQEKQIKSLIEWLDPSKKPVVVMGVLDDILYRQLIH